MAHLVHIRSLVTVGRIVSPKVPLHVVHGMHAVLPAEAWKRLAAHGAQGVAGCWSRSAEPGAQSVQRTAPTGAYVPTPQEAHERDDPLPEASYVPAKQVRQIVLDVV